MADLPRLTGPLAGQPRWPAPAKINRFLRIIGRRPDGYHQLQTLFQFLDWGDELEIAVRDDGQVVLHGGVTEDPEQDLTVRAARALATHAGCRLGAEIRLHKRVPPGSGLGGGSSDAATVLLVLNRLWQTRLPIEKLAHIALGLGADVPVFVRGATAWAEGVGERLRPMAVDEPRVVLALPGTPVSTAAVFSHPDLPRSSRPVAPDATVVDQLGNDCEALVRRLYPAVDAAFGWLSEFGRPRLSGTGCAVFLTVPDDASARRICASTPRGIRALALRTTNVSPLALALSAADGR